MLESVQKIACSVCLKQREVNYYSMLLLLDIPPMSTRYKYLKLTVMYNIDSPLMMFLEDDQMHLSKVKTLSLRLQRMVVEVKQPVLPSSGHFCKTTSPIQKSPGS